VYDLADYIGEEDAEEFYRTGLAGTTLFQPGESPVQILDNLGEIPEG
jgi:hypothetical protein